MSPNCPGRSNAIACCVTSFLRAVAKRQLRLRYGASTLIGIAPECQDEAEYYTLQNALSWRIDPIATTEIDKRLAAYGFDQLAISTEVYVQAREMFVLFEGLLNTAQTKRVLLLREIRNQRLGDAGMRQRH